MSNIKSKQTYKYSREKSIIKKGRDEYELSTLEYAQLYSFYVTHTLCSNSSERQRTFQEYGWSDETLGATYAKENKNTLKETLISNLDLWANKNFLFTEVDDLKERFQQLKLTDNEITEFDIERAVIAKTSGKNAYLKFFKHIRNCLAHGRYNFKISNNNEKFIIMEDRDKQNITARIVIKLSTLLGFIYAIDKEKLTYRFIDNTIAVA